MFAAQQVIWSAAVGRLRCEFLADCASDNAGDDVGEVGLPFAALPAAEPLFVPTVVEVPMRGPAAFRLPKPRNRSAARVAGLFELAIDCVAKRVGRGADVRTFAAVTRALKGGALSDRQAAVRVVVAVQVMVATRAVDYLKGAKGLPPLVRETMGANPFSGAVYMFRAKRADRIKPVLWGGTGVCPFAKRLEDGKFQWPSIGDSVVRLTAAKLQALLERLDLRRMHDARETRSRRVDGQDPGNLFYWMIETTW